MMMIIIITIIILVIDQQQWLYRERAPYHAWPHRIVATEGQLFFAPRYHTSLRIENSRRAKLHFPNTLFKKKKKALTPSYACKITNFEGWTEVYHSLLGVWVTKIDLICELNFSKFYSSIGRITLYIDFRTLI